MLLKQDSNKQKQDPTSYNYITVCKIKIYLVTTTLLSSKLAGQLRMKSDFSSVILLLHQYQVFNKDDRIYSQ